MVEGVHAIHFEPTNANVHIKTIVDRDEDDMSAGIDTLKAPTGSSDSALSSINPLSARRLHTHRNCALHC